MMTLSAEMLPQAASRSRPRRNEFDVREFTEKFVRRHTVLGLALKSEIRHFWVEFLLTNEAKPHVIFKFNFYDKFEVANRPFISCRLAMDVHEDEDEVQGPGACVLKICSYAVRTKEARAAFQFTVNRANTANHRWTLQHVIDTVLGRHPGLPANMRSSLAPFHFVTPNGDIWYDGCRDWVAQVFIRLHYLGLVSWELEGIIGPEAVKSLDPGWEPEVHDAKRQKFFPLPNSGCPTIDWGTAGFHDIIGKFFLEAEAHEFRDGKGRPYVAHVVYYRRLDLVEGIVGRAVTRFYHSQRAPIHVLPYCSQIATPHQGGPGAPGRPGSSVSGGGIGGGSRCGSGGIGSPGSGRGGLGPGGGCGGPSGGLGGRLGGNAGSSGRNTTSRGPAAGQINGVNARGTVVAPNLKAASTLAPKIIAIPVLTKPPSNNSGFTLAVPPLSRPVAPDLKVGGAAGTKPYTAPVKSGMPSGVNPKLAAGNGNKTAVKAGSDAGTNVLGSSRS
ncbi:hypothetical protein VTI74DRAFT_2967 [Chaetomium olivicolor]